MLIERPCAHCNNMFEPRRSDAKYCSDKCKFEAFKARKLSGAAPAQKTSTETVVKTSGLTPPEPLPIGAKFVLDELTRQREKLENQVEELTSELKSLKERNAELEKERDNVKGELEKKPSALAGFFSDRENVRDLMKELPDMIGGIVQHFKKPEPSNQIGAAPATDHSKEPLIVWLVSQTPEFRQQFMDVVNALAQNPQRALEIVASFKRQLMTAGIKTGT